jgi:hypothetical protein
MMEVGTREKYVLHYADTRAPDCLIRGLTYALNPLVPEEGMPRSIPRTSSAGDVRQTSRASWIDL